MGAVAAGLIVATALKLLPTLRSRTRWACRLTGAIGAAVGAGWSAGGAGRWCGWCWGLGAVSMALAAWRLP
jgi:hypothetical protein